MIIYDDTIIGIYNFHNINWQIPSAYIGYWCKTLYTGIGFMQEAVTALMLYGFEIIKLKRQNIICNDNNVKSKNPCAQRLVFHL